MSVRELIKKYSKPELRKQPGHVLEVWEDGEVTLQKSGDLYGQRSLHMQGEGFVPKSFAFRWESDMDPHGPAHANIAVASDEHAREIRSAMLEEFYTAQKNLIEIGR